MRPSADALNEAVLVLGTLGAPERRRLRGGGPLRRKPPLVDAGEPEPVPTARATIVRGVPFPTQEEAAAWLSGLRAEREALDAELAGAVAVLNRALRAQRAAAADPYVAEVSPSRALAVRVGYGSGEAVAAGRWAEAVELPAAGARLVRRSMEAPEERFAALLGGREEPLAAEELVLRARADLDAARPREAALQARVAIEALLAELRGSPAVEAVAGHREAVASAAAAALEGPLPAAAATALAEAVAAMEAALRRHRLRR